MTLSYSRPPFTQLLFFPHEGSATICLSKFLSKKVSKFLNGLITCPCAENPWIRMKSLASFTWTTQKWSWIVAEPPGRLPCLRSLVPLTPLLTFCPLKWPGDTLLSTSWTTDFQPVISTNGFHPNIPDFYFSLWTFFSPAPQTKFPLHCELPLQDYPLFLSFTHMPPSQVQ